MMKYLAASAARFVLLLASLAFAPLALPPAHAQTGTLTSGDIGAVAAAGSVTESGGVFTVRGSGEDIWETTDEFHYHRRAWTGDGVFIARVSNVTNTHAWAKAGIMLRATLAPDSPHYLVCLNGGGYPARIYRPSPGGSFATAALETEDRTGSLWIKLIREQNTVSTFYSLDGATWRSVGVASTTLPASLFVGLAVTSHVDGTLCTATFDNVSFLPLAPTNLAAATRGPGQIDLAWRDVSYLETGFELERSTDGVNFARIATVSPNTANGSGDFPRRIVPDSLSYSDTTVLAGTTYHYRVRHLTPSGPSGYSNVAVASTSSPAPTGWDRFDIGSAAPTGSVSANGTNAFVISGGGAGIGGVNFHHESSGRGDLSYTVFGASDSFHFLYRAWTGDGEIIARIAQPVGATLSQAGIMVRGGLDANARHACFYATGGGAVLLVGRPQNSTDTRFRDQTTTFYTAPSSTSLPTWLKLVRAGGAVIAYTSTDGANWTEVHYATLPMPTTIQVGLGVSNRQDGTTATGTFDNVTLRPVSTPLPTPAAPTNLAAPGVSPYSLNLTWTNNAMTYDWFEVQRSTDGVNYTTSVAQTAAYTDNSITAGTTYTYRVRTIRAGIPSAFSNTISVTVPSSGGSPSNLVATAVLSWRVDLTWNDNSSDETGFVIHRWSTFSDFATIASLPANTTSYSDTSAAASTTYNYLVEAHLPTGTASSNTAVVTTPSDGSTPPATPSGLAATASSSSQINLTWTDQATTETGYAIDRSTDGSTFTALVNLPANSTSYSDTGLLAARTYHYRVRATIGSVTSPPSNVASATTQGSSTPGTWTRTDVGAVGVAGSHSGLGNSFTVTGSGADIWDTADEFSFLHQSWSGDGTFVIRAVSVDYTHGWAKAGIMLRESLADNARHLFLAIAAGQPAGLYVRNATGGSTTFTATPLETKPLWLMLGRAGNTFQAHYSTDGSAWTPLGSPFTLDLPPNIYAGLAVTSHNDGTLATAAFDNVAFTGATGPDPITLNAPSELVVTAPAHDQLALAWRDNANNEGGFDIERSSDAANFTRIATRPANTVSFTDTGLTPTTTYYYRVRATLSTSVSNYSNIASNTTRPPPSTTPPAAPSGLTATVVSTTGIQLNWTDNSTDETEFLIESSTDGTNFTLLQRTPQSTWLHYYASPATTYYYRVQAVRRQSAFGLPDVFSDFSNVATATTPSTPPPPDGNWDNRDIGDVAAAGSATESGGVVTIRASGADIWNRADEFFFRSETLTGNFIFTARVTGLTNTNPWAKAGLMFRESLVPGSPHAFMCVSAEHGTSFQHRPTAGENSAALAGTLPSTLPVWLRLVRDSFAITAFESTDGVTWIQTGREWLWNGTAYVGLAVTSHNDGILTTATFDNISLVNTDGQSAPATPSNLSATPVAASAAPFPVDLRWTDNSTNEAGFRIERSTDNTTFTWIAEVGTDIVTYRDLVYSPGVYYYRIRAHNSFNVSGYTNSVAVTVTATSTPPPATWQHADVGTVGIAGSDDTSGTSSIIVRGSGADIWESADGFRFLYRVMSGDCTVEAQVSSLTNTHSWAKAGVMIRESLAPGARNAFALVTAANGAGAQVRTTTNDTTGFTAGPWGSNAPYWVRLRRTGNTLTASTSPDGTTWTTLATYTLTLPTEVYVGFAVTSHDNAQLATAIFSDPFIQ